MNRLLTVSLIGLALVCFTGCIREDAVPDGTRFMYETWVGIVAILVGIGATTVGWFMKGDGFRGWVFFIIALIATVFFAPFAFFDHVTVTSKTLKTHWGFWVFPTRHEFQFDNVQSVVLTEKVRHTRRGRRTSYNLQFSLRDRTVESLSATNALMEKAVDKIVEQLHARGINVQDHTR